MHDQRGQTYTHTTRRVYVHPLWHDRPPCDHAPHCDPLLLLAQKTFRNDELRQCPDELTCQGLSIAQSRQQLSGIL